MCDVFFFVSYMNSLGGGIEQINTSDNWSVLESYIFQKLKTLLSKTNKKKKQLNTY